jgi:Ulp1 family protease
LGDEILNFKRLLFRRDLRHVGKDQTLTLFSTHFYAKVNQPSRSVDQGRRWLRRAGVEHLRKVEMMLFPIEFGEHWILLVVDFHQKKFIRFDSYQVWTTRVYANMPTKVAGEIGGFLYGIYEAEFQNSGELRSIEWELVIELCPQQEVNSIECGLFVLGFMESLILGKRLMSFRGKQATQRRTNLEKEITAFR